MKFQAIQSNTTNINKGPAKRNCNTSSFWKWRFWWEIKHSRHQIEKLFLLYHDLWTIKISWWPTSGRSRGTTVAPVNCIIIYQSNIFHSGQSVKVSVQHPDSIFYLELIVLKCSEMNDWAINSDASMYWAKFIIYKSHLSWVNTIILSNNIWIRNHGYHFWTGNIFGKVVDFICQLFPVWLWNKAWFSRPLNCHWPWPTSIRCSMIDHLWWLSVNVHDRSWAKENQLEERYNWLKVMVFLIKILCWLYFPSFLIIYLQKMKPTGSDKWFQILKFMAHLSSTSANFWNNSFQTNKNPS